MDYVYIGLLMLLSYLLGSIPSGLILGKVFKKIDIREHGSKSTGATNTIRVLGIRLGIFAFLFDVLKGALVIAIVFLIGNPSLYIVSQYNITISAFYGLAAVLGHVFPVYIKFKGGKAVATSAGMILAIEPWVALGIMVVFITVFLTTRYVSLASTACAIGVLLFFIIRIFFEHPLYNFATRIMDLVIIAILGTIIFIKHKGNYQRLRDGTESKM
ncbi:MAG: glycerol-3-phosphate 1-O-acyltransferase PlsY [Acholeplasmataceae bacterium]|nr:glycerol-3-phosphate 1-O-acyltransferase PlsY [Acholeplasmataceae bacterium]